MIARPLNKVKDFMEWVDCHPRTGWWVALIVTLHFVLDLAQSLL